MLSGGTATFSTSSLAVGSHSITASYGGDTNDAGSSSGAVSQTINPDATTTSVSSSVNPSVFGQSVTFTATVIVTGPGSGTPAGTVNFQDGATTLGSGTLDSGGHAKFSTSALAAGSHSITAVFAGSVNFAGSTSSARARTSTRPTPARRSHRRLTRRYSGRVSR